MEIISIILIAVAAIVIATNVIVEVTKNTKYLNKIPTELEVLVLSLVLSIVGFLAYASYSNLTITWYYIFAVIIAGFFVAFISMFGWEKLIVIINKFKVPKELREIYQLTSEEKTELDNQIYNTSDESNKKEDNK